MPLLTQTPRAYGPALYIFTLVFCISVQPVSADQFTNFLGMKFVSIPDGKFIMGAEDEITDAVEAAESPRAITVTAFQIMPTEVTLAQYKRYIIESARIHLVTDEFISANSHDDEAPVVYVSWTDTRYFLHWLNLNKPDDDQGTYSMPTEAEWEYACRAGSYETYCGGNTANAVSWNSSQNIAYQQPVARKKANAFGLYDMSGNVHEWVMDCYGPEHDKLPARKIKWGFGCQPVKRVVRGGSWNDPPWNARATGRLMVDINSRSPTIGIRVVRRLP